MNSHLILQWSRFHCCKASHDFHFRLSSDEAESNSEDEAKQTTKKDQQQQQEDEDEENDKEEEEEMVKKLAELKAEEVAELKR